MNHAWANPITGVREQTTAGESSLVEARWRVWNELQAEGCGNGPVAIYRQLRIATIGTEGSQVDEDACMSISPQEEDHTFAWADPKTGLRVISETYPDEAKIAELQASLIESGFTSLAIYAQWWTDEVSGTDPKPQEPPEPALFRSDTLPRTDSDPIADRLEQLENVVILDDQTRVATITAWALLDIAKSFRQANAPRMRPPVWERLWNWFWGDSDPAVPLEWTAEGPRLSLHKLSEGIQVKANERGFPCASQPCTNTVTNPGAQCDSCHLKSVVDFEARKRGQVNP